MKSIRHMVHPYIFVLKEGKNIEHNRLDYNLMMLKVCPAEYFPSPDSFKYCHAQSEHIKEDSILEAGA